MGDQIEEIKKLYAKDKEYKIPKDVKEGQIQATISITPLGLDDIASLDVKKDASMKEVADNAKELFSKSLKIEKEEAGKLAFEFMEELIECIMDANNFNEKDMEKTGMKKFLEDKRKLIKEEKEKDDTGTIKEA